MPISQLSNLSIMPAGKHKKPKLLESEIKPIQVFKSYVLCLENNDSNIKRDYLIRLF